MAGDWEFGNSPEKAEKVRICRPGLERIISMKIKCKRQRSNDQTFFTIMKFDLNIYGTFASLLLKTSYSCSIFEQITTNIL